MFLTAALPSPNLISPSSMSSCSVQLSVSHLIFRAPRTLSASPAFIVLFCLQLDRLRLLAWVYI